MFTLVVWFFVGWYLVDFVKSEKKLDQFKNLIIVLSLMLLLVLAPLFEILFLGGLIYAVIQIFP